LEPQLLNALIGQIATLSSIYHKPPEAFVIRSFSKMSGAIDDNEEDEEEEEEDEEEYEDENDATGNEDPAEGVDLLDMGGINLSKDPVSSAPNALGQDLFGSDTSQVEPVPRMSKVCGPDKSNGIEVFAGFRQVNNVIKMELEFKNVSCPSAISSLAIQLNKNSFGLSPANQQISHNPPIPTGSSGRNTVDLVVTPNMLAPVPAGQPATPQVQVAIKNMAIGSVFYFAVNFNLEAMFAGDGALDRTTFIESWKNIDDRKEFYSTVAELHSSSCDIEQVQSKFKSNNIFFIARRPVPNAEGQEVVYFSMRTVTGMDFMVELTFKQGVNACKVCLKTESIAYGLIAKSAIENLLRN